MKFYIKGDTRPVIGKNLYSLMYSKTDKDKNKGAQLYVANNGSSHKEVDGSKIVKQHWTLIKNGKLFLDLGKDGGVTFSQASLGIPYIIRVTFTDSYGVTDTAQLSIIPVAGKPSIENLKWQNQYYQDLNGKPIGYSDNVRLFIHTLNIPAGDRLEVTIWEDEGTDGHGSSSRNMGTYKTTPVDKYGKSEVFFNNIKVYQTTLNDKDYRNEDEHEFYAQVKYRGKIDTIKDTIQLKIVNELKKMVEVPKNNSLAKIAVPDKKKKPKEKKGVKVTINVFFDGTLNNAKNTEARLAYEEETKAGVQNNNLSKDAKAFRDKDEVDSSYDNYYSNISIMHQLNIENLPNKVVKVYIEGEGTTNFDKDDTSGFAFGDGNKSGIPVKVSKAFTEIKNRIDRLKKDKIITKDEIVNEIELTVFGFSRGATAARNFISQRRKLQDLYNLESDKFTIKFVGLFDTVSSYHDASTLVTGGINKNFDNDVEELQLKLEGNVKKVVHLTAADEYRENFSLTNVKSSVEAGVAFELQLPGVHSDIGGGYEEIQKIEDRRLSSNMMKFNEVRNSFIDQGWYTPKEFITKEVNKDDNTDHYELELHGIRKNIPNSYQYIPLAIMIQLAEKHGLKFDKSVIDNKGKKFNVPEDLQFAKKSLLAYALQNDSAASKKVTVNQEYLKDIRNKYLHRSASDAFGLGGRYTAGLPYRKIIDG